MQIFYIHIISALCIKLTPTKSCMHVLKYYMNLIYHKYTSDR